MGDAARKVREQAMALPEDERELLAAELFESLGERDDDWEEAWSAEIVRRIEEARSGKVVLRSWDEVRADLHARLAAKRAP